ncbi:MAG: hypothetical protein NTW25_12525 [Candidatus Kapabacteria bacterium]|nr:hypothetical protein [Candidatus Kapabacteria bacterium]
MKKIIKLSIIILFIISQNAKSQWQEINNGLNGGNYNSISMIDSTIYVGSWDNGILKSSDNGKKWVSINSGLKNTNITAISSKEDLVCVGIDFDGIFISSNNGENWKHISISNRYFPNKISKIEFIDNKIYFCTSFRIGFTSDLGDNWTEIDSGLNCKNIYSLIKHNNSLYAGTEYGVFHFTNDNFWKRLSLFDCEVYDLVSKGMKFYAATNKGIFLSTNNGIDWVNIGFKDKNVYSIKLINSKIIIGVDSGNVFLSDIEEINWQKKNLDISNCKIQKLEVNNNNIIASTNGRGIFKSSDYGETWDQIGLPTVTCNNMVNVSNSILLSTDYGLFKSSDNGDVWLPINSGFDDFNFKPIAVDRNNIYTLISDKIYLSNDNGNKWVNQKINLNKTYFNTFSIIQNNFYLTYKGGVSISKDKGLNWNQSESGLTNTNIRNLIHRNELLFAATDHGVSISSDNGINWELKNIGLNNFDVKVVEQNANYVFAGTQNGLYFTSNNAENWKLIEIPMLKSAINAIKIFNNIIFIGTYSDGVFLSTDVGKSWNQINSDLKNLKVNCLSIINDYIFVGTFKGSVYRAKLSDFGFSEIKEDRLFDNSFSIFPNPAQKHINITLKSELNNKFKVLLYFEWVI